MPQVITLDTLRTERRKYTGEIRVPYVAPGGAEREAVTRMVAGELETFELDRPMGEMLTTPANLDTLVQKTVIDLQLGREAIPLLYGPIYRRMEDANFTQNVTISGITRARVVFVARMELEEVQFGDRYIGPQDTVPIITYAAGLQWTEDMLLYDKTWEVAEASRAFGEAYNALLNHIHLYPILNFTYASKNQTAADTNGTTYREKLRNTIRAGLIHASQDMNTDTRNPRRPSILLAHSSKRWDIEDALQRFTIGGTEYDALSGVDTIIFYDGYTTDVGGKTYTYAGVNPGKAYLIEPQRYFRELVKHDLRVDAGNADLSRLLENQVVGRARRGVYASPSNACEELTLP